MFQVANFEYIDEAEAAAEEEAQKPAVETKSAISNSERTSYWEELLKDRYEVHKIEEFNALGKGKRSRKQVLCQACSVLLDRKEHLLTITKYLSLLGM